MRILLATALGLWILTAGPAQQETLTPLSQPPVALGNDEIPEKLRKWYASGTAAGNVGDYYDNRDGGHSPLNLTLYPQLQKIEYTQEQIKARQNWGMQQEILPYVIFGNSSTSAPPEQGGSNVRSYYTDPRGLAFLFTQYTHNNLYIYPEHLDHDPGHNGIGGYGDLFPTNTPYLITSQGSSGSDQAFMQALPYVLAAFSPDVKKKLIQAGLLMPTIQMILRITNRQLANSGEYLTGKAHPSVFVGDNVDTLAMVEMAHRITLSNLPPIAAIRTVKEDKMMQGVDYFEPAVTESLSDTPIVIARVFRGSKYTRKMTISAESSRDLNGRPLKFYWEVLRGDPRQIKIEYMNAAHSVAEITIPYHERRSIDSISGLESNRVDIGVFVHNGSYYSPPAFVTSYTLDNEARTYRSDEKPLDIAYGIGSSTISVVDWNRFFKLLDPGSGSWESTFLRNRFTAAELSSLQETAVSYRKAHETLLSAKEALNTRDTRDPELAAARKTVQNAQESERRITEEKGRQVRLSAAEIVTKAMNSLLEDPDLWNSNADHLRTLYASASKDASEAFAQARDKLIRFGVAGVDDRQVFRLKPLAGANAPVAQRLTNCEKALIGDLNAIVLSRILFPGIVESRWRENYVDPRIASAIEWRDVYQYSPDRTLTGWRRYQQGGILEFNAEGLLVLDRDSQGRCIRGRVVRYELEPQKGDSRRKRVKSVATDVIREYEYAGPNDWNGHAK